MERKNSQEKSGDLDVRIKLLIIIEAGLLTFFTGSNELFFVAALVSFIILLWFRQIRSAVKYTLVFLFVLAISWLSSLLEGQVFAMVLGMFSFLILRMIPVLMLGSWLVHTVKINDFITAMEKLKLPTGIVITLAVTLRFIPTIQTEFRYIKNTMKMRGISLSLGSVVRKPLMTTEYAMVPLLMRSIKIADELSASALTRGLGQSKTRTSYRDVYLCRTDILWAVTYSVFTIALSLMQKLGLTFFS